MDPRDDPRRQADMDWLYGSERPNPDRTRILDDKEMAELDRRRASAAQTGAQAAQAAQEASQEAAAAPRRDRVVHSEKDFAPAATPSSSRSLSDDLSRRAAPSPSSRPAAATPPPPVRPTERRSAAAPKPPRPVRAPRASRRRGWLRWLVLALVAWLVWLAVVPMLALARTARLDEQPSADRPPEQPGTTTLLVGSDARENLSAEQQKELGTGTEGGKRTDTMMLLYTPPSGKPALVSLPRDSYVSIPGHNKNKLNAAYSIGGPELLVQTVEQDTGLRIDNYMEVGFDGFANVVDAVGGIKVCLDNPIKDKDSHLDLPAGCQTLDGTDSLGYVRMRKADPTGDLGRTKRQRQVMGLIAKKAASPMTFINPIRYWRLNMAVGSAVTRGQETGAGDVAGVASAMLKMSSGDGHTLAVPVTTTNTTTAAGSSVLWDEQAAADMFGQMARGSTDGLEKYAK
ncbi:LCP family protein [Luteococcus peritonei]|uniref:LCP family protein n=1 Tax=Luteococcus peritonei TaxID=88874 RepID=A0ABW4RY50_9ACTN